MKLKSINTIPKEIVEPIEGIDELKINLLKDFDVDILKKAIEFEDELFGELGMDQWGIVPQIRHGNVYVLNETDEKSDLYGIAIMMRDWDDLDQAYLFDFAIAEEYQNKGLGTEFLRIIANHLSNQDFGKISLTVDPENEPAVHVYKNKLGFEILETSQHEYGENVERFIMKLDLDQYND